MLKIRLARHGRKKLPFYRIVLTEHTKPAQAGYKLVLGWFNPLSHTMEADIPAIKEWISKGAQPTERVAKLLFADTKDDFFKKYFIERESTKGKEIEAKKKAEAEAKAQELKEKQEAAKAAAEEVAAQEEVKSEVAQTEESVVENMENSEPAEETAGEKVEEAIVETTTETQDEANTTPEEPAAQTE
ncbi:MAG TPA: 30S ribosomal protein S16 [Candidatus Absconditabacterales bacterium]|nr:30S ribosomal protein S16 [Candidatus Absconditabacterales bacterium]